MQLKLKRYQREGGVISKTAIFCLDARVELTAEEQADIRRYKLNNQILYNSEASQQALAASERASDGSLGGNFKGLALAALAHMKLNISVDSLQCGQHIECKTLDELLGAEEAVTTGCKNLKSYLDTAATFDGRELVISFDEDGDPIVTAASEPKKQIATQPASAMPAAPPLPQSPASLPAPEAIMAAAPTAPEPAYVAPAANFPSAGATLFAKAKTDNTALALVTAGIGGTITLVLMLMHVQFALAFIVAAVFAGLGAYMIKKS
jgi:hypothetical protein